MQVSTDVRMAHPEQAPCHAAHIMVGTDIGALPGGRNDRLVGMVATAGLAVAAGPEAAGSAIEGAARP